MIAVYLDPEQLRQVIEGIGHRIDYMRENHRDYEPDEIEAARTALDVLTAAAHQGQPSPRGPAV